MQKAPLTGAFCFCRRFLRDRAGAARSFGAMRIPKMDQEILQTVLSAYREDEFV
jgi:hypothetical protein